MNNVLDTIFAYKNEKIEEALKPVNMYYQGHKKDINFNDVNLVDKCIRYYEHEMGIETDPKNTRFETSPEIEKLIKLAQLVAIRNAPGMASTNTKDSS